MNRRQCEEGSSPSVRDEILTTDEVCILLKIKKSTLYRHTSQGTGPPFYKIGKHNRWKRSEVMGCIRIRHCWLVDCGHCRSWPHWSLQT